MSETTNLSITHIQAAQNSKEVTANEAFDILDGAAAGQVELNIDGLSGDYTPTSTSMIRALTVKLTGAPAGALNIIVPNNRKMYWVWNYASGNVTVKTAAGSGIAVSSLKARFCYCDGTDVISMQAYGSTGISQATEKTSAFVTGAGGTSDLAIGATVLSSSVEVYVDGIRARKGAGRDYTVTESVPASGNYDQLTPEYADAFPSGASIEILYYT